MRLGEIEMIELTTAAAQQLVPAGYAEKAMASLMQLHSELMDEKERRVELFRRLMEREQALAELKVYVKILEERVNPPAPVVAPAPVAPAQTVAAAPVEQQPIAPPPRRPRQVPPVPPQLGQRPRVDGWKTW
jgi:hypothetical protein